MAEKVIVVPYDPAWKDAYKSESRIVSEVLGENAISVHHIGSTAIPGAMAKPVIDILIVASNLEHVDHRNSEMERLGYEVMGEYGIANRRYFRKCDEAGIRTHHIHVFTKGAREIQRHCVFRDFLNAHPDWVEKYSDLKVELVHMHPESSEKYSRGKNSFITNVIELAETWKYKKLRGDE